MAARPSGKEVAGALLAAVLVTTTPSAAAGSGAQRAGLQSIQDLQHRFMISVPVTWEVQWSRKDPAVSAKSPTTPGELADTVNVFVRDLPSPISPQDCVRLVERVMRFTIHRWTTLEEGPNILAGLPAYSLSYTWKTDGGTERRSVQTCVMVGRRAFIVIGTITNTSSHADVDLANVTSIMGTFHPLAGAPDTGPPRRQAGGEAK